MLGARRAPDPDQLRAGPRVGQSAACILRHLIDPAATAAQGSKRPLAQPARPLTPACAAQVILNGKVYDVTPFLDEHPGGFDIIVSNTGEERGRGGGGGGLLFE